MASLFQACKAAVRNKEGGTFNIGGYDIDIEMYSQQDIDDDIQYGDVAFGDSDESKIVLVAGNTITVPAGYTLTPDSPKKSLVIFCNELVNNGTISMYQKAPNVLPHDYYIIQGNVIGSNKNVVIPAYANNAKTLSTSSETTNVTAIAGNSGTDRQCGSGGIGRMVKARSVTTKSTSGSGYAFGGGAGSGAIATFAKYIETTIDEIYPMRGGNAKRDTDEFGDGYASGGVGNPIGSGIGGYYYHSNATPNNFGCGGRIIIFCISLINNGIITVNGTNANLGTIANGQQSTTAGGASGAGAVDLFYTTLSEQGTITANGGIGGGLSGASSQTGNGGNGSITLTQWNLDKVIKEERKMFTKNNWIYLFNNYSQRLREDVI